MIYLNGKWMADDQAKISVLDLSVLRGFGVFDFLRTYGKKPFRLDDHIERFFNSARLMGMTPVQTRKEIADLIAEGIEKNGFENTDIKMIQTGGLSKDGFITDRSYAGLTDRDKATRALDFQKLLDLKIIERNGKGRSTFYTLKRKN